ncbi:M16 family metallopeptidase [Penaeicola halotolerans]|uniref:M16 family metallopeptidase n=1 Tax=Penaeicola halotolerans TaxID=2793196 RepID=UPI001CF8E563|nr:pitrilysin family protein [Penaeicola halotolerans]
MLKKLKNTLLVTLFTGVLLACGSDQQQQEFSVDYEKFTLDNGLEVIFHVDKSDPVTAVALTFHVGSAREKEGRTGFAHLFEHLLFLESENLGKGGLDKLNAKVGGSGANGSTSRDRTNYYQTVPNDALEKMIWAEADKLGFFINTVTESVLAKEKEVVKNEKRQGVDNQPYGHASYVTGKNLYPEGHPYNWQVIGSLEDLQNATLADVKEFYKKWYVPNNATLVIAGDFDTAQAKAWVEKYFAEIPRGEEITPVDKMPVTLSETKSLYHEDNFARVPQLTMTWPTVEQYHPDSYALDLLTELLTSGKKAPFYKVLVEDKQVTSGARMYNYGAELAGETSLSVRAYPNVKLDDVKAAIDEAFAKFEADGVDQQALDRIKAGQETNFYNSLSGVLGKAFQLAQYNIFANDPGYINEDIQRVLAVEAADIMRVYEKYIKGKNYVATSFVPKGMKDLALTGATQAEVVEEQIVMGAEQSFDLSQETSYEKTPSSFDRSVEPPYGPAPQLSIPSVWQTEAANGMKVFGITNDELPLVQFNIRLKGGLLLEDPAKVGVSNLLATMLTKGTANKTPEELEEAIDNLGARISINAGKESFSISGNALARNYDAVLALVEEMLLQPRWDAKEFDLAKQQIASALVQQQGNPGAIAANAANELMYGKDNILSKNALGDVNTINDITIDDLKAYYTSYISPSVANMHIVGAIDQAKVETSLASLAEKWEAKAVTFPALTLPSAPEKSQVYFYDVPDAKQSQLRIGYLALAETDEDFYPASVMNYILGGGGFASRLTQELREGQGYTYGIGSGFSGSDIKGPFTISTGVRTNVTFESLALIKKILADYPTTFTEQDLETTKGFLLKSNARAFETLGAKLGLLTDMSAYGLPNDYVIQREQIVRDMTVARISELAKQYANPDRMIYLVVGDAKTQLNRLEALGYGKPVLLNPSK